MLNLLLDKFNVKYEDLNQAEKETLNQWYQNLARNELTLPRVTEFLEKLIKDVERDLARYDLSKTEDLFLKARLKNYLMLHDFLSAPEKAKKHIEESIKNIK